MKNLTPTLQIVHLKDVNYKVMEKDKMARKSKASSPIRPAPCVDFAKIKPHFQSFQQNDTQGTIDG